MKILIISNQYFPVINPRAFRWTNIAEYWATNGHGVDVLSSWRPGLPQFEKRNGVTIYRTGKTAFQTIRVRLLNAAEKTGGQRSDTGRTNKEKLKSKIIRLVKKVSDYTWKKIHWPDCECFWYFSAVKKARSLTAKNEYDSVISVSTPFTSHLIGLKVNSFNQSIKWLVDIGDPFSFHTVQHQNNYVLYNRLNFHFEKKVFSSADIISVTSKGTLEKYVSYFPECNNKIKVIPPLVSFAENDIKNNHFFTDSFRIRLLFVGNFYRPVRRPVFLLKVFDMLLSTSLKDRLELHIIGSVKDVMDYFTHYKELLHSKKIILHGVLEHKKALNAMNDADVLVNCGNDTSYQLPSKVVDYMALGKPIINFATVKDDSSSLILKDYPLSLNICDDGFTDESADFAQLVNFLQNLPASLDEKTIERIIRPYRTEAIACEYLRGW